MRNCAVDADVRDARVRHRRSSTRSAYNMLDDVTGAANYPGGINSTQAGYARNLYGFLTGRVTASTGTAYLQTDGTYTYKGDRTDGDDRRRLRVLRQRLVARRSRT